jgi:hypothetical protein
MKTCAAINYYEGGRHILHERFVHSALRRRFSKAVTTGGLSQGVFRRGSVLGLCQGAGGRPTEQGSRILAGSSSLSIAGITFDRHCAAAPAADDDVANLADLAAFD